MKDELDYKDLKSLKELRLRVNEYVIHYNSERYQWTLKKSLYPLMNSRPLKKSKSYKQDTLPPFRGKVSCFPCNKVINFRWCLGRNNVIP
ncbi:IS3 family transposase [Paenibacillus sp. FSL H7-0331]|uniref:IS3 family transposase n=1 Tax=Paenibacillus sp. FSL H7-0331 TaxID=1920421 RepID=UPI0030F953A9